MIRNRHGEQISLDRMICDPIEHIFSDTAPNKHGHPKLICKKCGTQQVDVIGRPFRNQEKLEFQLFKYPSGDFELTRSHIRPRKRDDSLSHLDEDGKLKEEFSRYRTTDTFIFDQIQTYYTTSGRIKYPTLNLHHRGTFVFGLSQGLDHDHGAITLLLGKLRRGEIPLHPASTEVM